MYKKEYLQYSFKELAFEKNAQQRRQNSCTEIMNGNVLM